MATYYLDPNSTITNTWPIIGAATAHEALDDAIRQPTTPNSGEQVFTGSTTATARLGCTSFVLSTNEVVSSVTVWIFVGGSGNLQAKRGIYVNGVQKALSAFDATTGWRSTVWSSGVLTQSEIDGLEVYLEGDSSNGLVNVDAAYLAVTTLVTTQATKTLAGAYSVFAPVVPINLQAKYVVGPKPAATTLTTLKDSYSVGARDLWRPMLSPGAFFLGTERYHLYGKKRTKTLAETAISVFKLAGPPTHGSMSVTYAGLTYDDWFLEGDELHLKHRNPLEWGAFYSANYANAEQKAWIEAGWLGKPSNSIAASYSYLVWSDAGQAFTTQAITQTFTQKDDESRRYYRIEDRDESFTRKLAASHSTHKRYAWFASRYGPLVLTDDWVENQDQRGEAPEFSLDPETGDLSFGTENLFRNPGFLLVDGLNAPYEWTAASGSLVTRTGSFPDEACYGKRYLALSGGQTVYQTLKARNPGPHTVSFYARTAAPSLGTGKYLGASYVVSGQALTTQKTVTVKVVLNPIGVAGTYLNTDGTSAGSPYTDGVEVLSKTVTVSGPLWTRYTVVFGTSSDFFTVDAGPLPKEALKFEVRLKATGDAADLDAVQIEEGYEAHPYLGLPGKATLEYEADPDGNYVPDPKVPEKRAHLLAAYHVAAGTNPALPAVSDHPYKRDDVDLNPALSEMPNGFLALTDDGGTGDFQLGRGGDDIGDGGALYARVLGRYHLPHAKVSGLGKLQPRRSFHLKGSPVEEDLAPDRTAIAADDSIPVVPELSFFGSPALELTAGYHVAAGTNPTVPTPGVSGGQELRVETKSGKATELVVIFLDQFQNPLAYGSCTITQKGSSETRTHTLKTDRSGRARFSHKLLSGASGKRAETVTFAVGGVFFTFTIDVV